MPAAERETASSVAYRREMQSQAADRLVSRLANRQYGVVSRGQLRGLGLTESAIDRRIRVGRLHVLHAGVFAVGHTVVPREGHWLAAVLRVGTEAALSHRSAAELWGVCRPRGGSPIDVATPRSARSTARIRRHHVTYPANELTTRRRIPVTTLARTLFDIAVELRPGAYEAALREALLADLRSLLAAESAARVA